jgi:hypothetical protein
LILCLCGTVVYLKQYRVLDHLRMGTGSILYPFLYSFNEPCSSTREFLYWLLCQHLEVFGHALKLDLWPLPPPRAVCLLRVKLLYKYFNIHVPSNSYSFFPQACSQFSLVNFSLYFRAPHIEFWIVTLTFQAIQLGCCGIPFVFFSSHLAFSIQVLENKSAIDNFIIDFLTGLLLKLWQFPDTKINFVPCETNTENIYTALYVDFIRSDKHTDTNKKYHLCNYDIHLRLLNKKIG